MPRSRSTSVSTEPAVPGVETAAAETAPTDSVAAVATAAATTADATATAPPTAATAAVGAVGGAADTAEKAPPRLTVKTDLCAVVSKTDAADVEEPIPDDFFAEFENEQFIEDIIESNVSAEASRDIEDTRSSVRSPSAREHDRNKDDDDDDDDDTRSRRSSTPIVENCLKAIEELTQDIRRRKRRVERELAANGSSVADRDSAERSTSSHRTRRHRRSRSRSRSPPMRQRDDYRHNKIFPYPYNKNAAASSYRGRAHASRHARSRSRSRTPSPERRNKSHQRLLASSQSTARRSGSSGGGGGGGSSSAGISFLDELERTFAKQGKQFPEKEMLLQQKRLNGGQLPNVNDDMPTAKRHRGDAGFHQQQQQLQQQQHAMPMMMQAQGMQVMQPQQQMTYPVTSGLMAAANAIIPPLPPQQQQQQPLQPMHMYPVQQPMYGAPMSNSLLPTPIMPMPDCQLLDMNMPMPLPMPITIIPDLSPTSALPPANVQVKIRSLQQSKAAIRLLCQAENRVPKMQFIFTRTMVAEKPNDSVGNSRTTNENTAPIRSAKNVLFAFTDTTATDARAAAKTTMPGRLAPRLRHITKVLGFNSEVLVAAARMKSQAQQVMETLKAADLHPSAASTSHQQQPPALLSPYQPATHQHFADVHQPTSSNARPPGVANRSASPTTRSVHIQTGPPEPCARCTARDALRCNARETQTDAPPKPCNVKTQTVETLTPDADGRSTTPLSSANGSTNNGGGFETTHKPLQLALGRMSAAQLVAMNDFARIICNVRTANNAETFALRDQLYDVYNLSLRDDEAVRLAEQDKLASVRNLLAAAVAVAPVVPAPMAVLQPPSQTRQPDFAMPQQQPRIMQHQQHQQQPTRPPAWTPSSFDWGAGGSRQPDAEAQWRWQQQQQMMQQRGGNFNGADGGDLPPQQQQTWMGQQSSGGPWAQNAPRPGNWPQQQAPLMQARGQFGHPNVRHGRPF